MESFMYITPVILFLILILLACVIIEVLKIRKTLQSIELSGRLSAGVNPEIRNP